MRCCGVARAAHIFCACMTATPFGRAPRARARVCGVPISGGRRRLEARVVRGGAHARQLALRGVQHGGHLRAQAVQVRRRRCTCAIARFSLRFKVS